MSLHSKAELLSTSRFSYNALEPAGGLLVTIDENKVNGFQSALKENNNEAWPIDQPTKHSEKAVSVVD